MRRPLEDTEIGQHIDFLDDFTVDDVLPSRPTIQEEEWDTVWVQKGKFE